MGLTVTGCSVLGPGSSEGQRPKSSSFDARLLWWAAASLCVLFIIPSLTEGSFATARFYRKDYMDDKIITTAETLVDSSNRVFSVLQCAVRCTLQVQCQTFFYVKQTSLCTLHSVLFLGADEAQVQIGSTYWQLTQDNCPYSENFILHRPLRLCYQYHFQKVHWVNANATCASQGTSLLKVNDSSTFQHVYAFLRGSSATRTEHVSVGASRVSGTWRWSDGAEVTWFNWASGEPSSATTEQCLTMAWFYYFKWNDVPCDSDTNAFYNFVCQKLM